MIDKTEHLVTLCSMKSTNKKEKLVKRVAVPMSQDSYKKLASRAASEKRSVGGTAALMIESALTAK